MFWKNDQKPIPEAERQRVPWSTGIDSLSQQTDSQLLPKEFIVIFAFVVFIAGILAIVVSCLIFKLRKSNKSIKQLQLRGQELEVAQ